MTREFEVNTDQNAVMPGKRPYDAPKLTRHGSVRNMTGGSTFLNFDQFCGGSTNGIEDCFN